MERSDEVLVGALPSRSATSPGDDLLEQARAFSDAAWAQIYDQHYVQIFNYCFLRTGNRVASEDLAADVFLEALRGIHRYEYRGIPIIAWLYRIAHNLTADFLQRKTNRPSVRLTSEADGGRLRSPDTAEGSAIRVDLAVAIEQLTQDQQQVIALRFFHGLSHEETAAVMGKRSGAVRVLQNRALGALRRLMAA